MDQSFLWRSLRLTKAALGADFFIGGDVAVVPHVGLYLLHASGTFQSDRKEDGWTGGPGAGLGLALRLSPSIDLRMDGSAGLLVDSSASTWQSLRLGVTWWVAP